MPRLRDALTFPCPTCEGSGKMPVVMHEDGCMRRGACPCGTMEVDCWDESCISGSVACGICGLEASTQEARYGGVACERCAKEEESE